MAQIGMSKMPARKPLDKPTGEATVVISKGDDTEKANLDLNNKLSAAFNKRDMKALTAAYDPKAKLVDVTMPADVDPKKMMAFMGEIAKGMPDAKTDTVDA